MVRTTVQEGPHFGWPTIPDEQQTDFVGQVPITDSTIETSTIQQSVTHTVDEVVSTVKDIITNMVNNQTESTFTSTESNLQEAVNSNNTMMATNNTSFTEMMGSNNTFMEVNNTIITELPTTIATTFGESSDSTSFVSETMTETTVSTTETIFNTVFETMTSANENGTSDEHMYHAYGDNIEEKTLYIILGVILAALILIIVILLIIYKRYKTMGGIRSGAYCVTDLNEVSVSSCNQKDEQQIEQHISRLP